MSRPELALDFLRRKPGNASCLGFRRDLFHKARPFDLPRTELTRTRLHEIVNGD